jgi:hypothetical protein
MGHGARSLESKNGRVGEGETVRGRPKNGDRKGAEYLKGRMGEEVKGVNGYGETENGRDEFI